MKALQTLKVLLLAIAMIAASAHSQSNEDPKLWTSSLEGPFKLGLKNSSDHQNEKKFFLKAGLNYDKIKKHLRAKDKQLNFYKIYDRPNDDDYQNEKLRLELGLDEVEGFAYSTARVVLALQVVPAAQENSYSVYAKWIAQMSVGTHTESARFCVIEFKDKQLPLTIEYPSNNIGPKSASPLKKGSLIVGPDIFIGEIDQKKDQDLSGSFALMRGTHRHYVVEYRIIVKDSQISEVELNSSNQNPSYKETDLYPIAQSTPLSNMHRKSLFFTRSEEEVKAVEITGDGYLQLGSIFKKNSCLDCHASDVSADQKFDDDTGVPIDPSDLWFSLEGLVKTYQHAEREDIVYNQSGKRWPSKMKKHILKMLQDQEDQAYLQEWFRKHIESLKSH
ncbi:hypothetical protein GW915_05800 [bacterium]|nr:hypothetical protein [bacterium]